MRARPLMFLVDSAGLRGEIHEFKPRHCKVPKLHRYCTGICQDVTAYAMGSLQAVQRVAGTVVSAGAWPLIRAGDIAKHPAPADHLEALQASRECPRGRPQRKVW